MNRRAFVGMTAGTAAAGAGVLLPQFFSVGAQTPAPGAGANTVRGVLARQVERSAKAFEDGRQGEHLRSLAQSLRVLAALDRDAPPDRGLRRLLQRPWDASFDVAAHLKANGHRVPAGGAAVSPAEAERVRRRVQREGLAPMWERQADLLDRLAPEIDRLGLVAARQADWCAILRYTEMELDVMLFYFCGWGLPATWENCLIGQGLLVAIKIAKWSLGC